MLAFIKDIPIKAVRGAGLITPLLVIRGLYSVLPASFVWWICNGSPGVPGLAPADKQVACLLNS